MLASWLAVWLNGESVGGIIRLALVVAFGEMWLAALIWLADQSTFTRAHLMKNSGTFELPQATRVVECSKGSVTHVIRCI